jgi:hypothetical protein
MFLGFLIALQVIAGTTADTLRISNEEISPTASNVLARVLTVISSKYSVLEMDTMDTNTGLTVGFSEFIPDSVFVGISRISYYAISNNGSAPDSLVSEKIGYLVSDWITPTLARYFNKVPVQSWDQLISALLSGQIEHIVVSDLAEIPKIDKSLRVTKLVNFNSQYGLNTGLNDQAKLNSIVSQYRADNSRVLSKTNSLAEQASNSDRDQLIRYSVFGIFAILSLLISYVLVRKRIWTYGEVLVSGHVLVRSKAITSDSMDVEKLRNKMIQIRDGMEELVSTYPFLILQHDSSQTKVKLEISGKSYVSDAGKVISIMQDVLEKSVSGFISEDDMLYCDLSIRVNIRKYTGTLKYELYNSGGGLKLKNVLI